MLLQNSNIVFWDKNIYKKKKNLLNTAFILTLSMLKASLKFKLFQNTQKKKM